MLNFRCLHCGGDRLMCHDSGVLLIRPVHGMRFVGGDLIPELGDIEFSEEDDRKFVCDDCGHAVGTQQLATMAESVDGGSRPDTEAILLSNDIALMGAVNDSIQEDRRVRLTVAVPLGMTLCELDVMEALEELGDIDDLETARENDGSIDVWGTRGGCAFRLLLSPEKPSCE